MANDLQSKVDFYELLGIDRRADNQEVKQAYRNLAKQYHPDINQDPKTVNVFHNIQSAYEILSDPYKRGIYDHLLYRQEQRKRQGHYRRQSPSNGEAYQPHRPQQRQQPGTQKQMPETRVELLRFHLKQAFGLFVTLIVLLTGMVLTGLGLNFIFVEDFNGSLVAGYFTTAIGLGLMYGMGQALKVVFTI